MHLKGERFEKQRARETERNILPFSLLFFFHFSKSNPFQGPVVASEDCQTSVIRFALQDFSGHSWQEARMEKELKTDMEDLRTKEANFKTFFFFFLIIVFRIECIAAQIECYGSNLFTLAKSTASSHSWPHSKSIRSALGNLNAVEDKTLSMVLGHLIAATVDGRTKEDDVSRSRRSANPRLDNVE
ncbi:uncharacterized protein LOC122308964 isoform X3 [Carya illinoinensis]|uniref:uncharacterized protein LOC122308964 isoform X3 n=1 Tax=Carya illinoinensis TaxID=32201 RepID=UPI001C71F0B5|nr:uncharacterized protein LOC122308964 isoform X3 [Carya illinoinensis]